MTKIGTCAHWVRGTGYAQASLSAACPWCELENLRNELTAARLERSSLQDIDLAPIKRTQANLWQLKYFEALHALQAANRGAQRLRRRLDEAQRRLRRAGRPLDEREAPHCANCSCGLHPTGDGAKHNEKV